MASDTTTFMYDVSPAWNEETIATLLNKTLFHIETKDASSNCQLPKGYLQVEIIVNNNNKTDGGGKRKSKLRFASHAELMEVTESYQGLLVPLTHGYHYFLFDPQNEDNGSAEGGNSIDNETATTSSQSQSQSQQLSLRLGIWTLPSPPLHLQLMALPSEELLYRTEGFMSSSTTTTTNKAPSVVPTKPSRKRKTAKRISLLQHARVASRLCQQLQGSRAVQQCSGIPVEDRYTRSLLQILRGIPEGSRVGTNNNNHITDLYHWPIPTKQRKGVQSKNYLTLRQKHAPVWDTLWRACYDLLASVYGVTSTNGHPIPAYNALAVTKNFRGSPHVDQHDKTFQHVIALGDFEGGCLCTEYDAETELQIQVRNRLGRMDGRAVHWVSGWTGRERYSIVYYSTDAKDYTEPLPIQEHVRFMQDFCQGTAANS